MLSMFSAYPSLEDAAQACEECRACELSQSRQKVVFGAGHPEADVMFIGQGPSPTDDHTGLPYSGPAGELFDTALEQAGTSRSEVWITNLHKCLATRFDPKTQASKMRPPKVAEIKACSPWLDEELFWIKPKVLVLIGSPAAKALLGKDFQLSEQQGQWQVGPQGLPTLAIPQPTYLKRISEWDRPAAVQGWRELIQDLQAALQRAQRDG